MNKITKMRRTNQKATRFYRKHGYMVFIKPHTRWNKDIFNLFDGIIIGNGTAKLVQIKSNQFARTKEIEDFAKKYNVPCEIIVFKDGEKEPRIKSYL